MIPSKIDAAHTSKAKKTSSIAAAADALLAASALNEGGVKKRPELSSISESKGAAAPISAPGAGALNATVPSKPRTAIGSEASAVDASRPAAYLSDSRKSSAAAAAAPQSDAPATVVSKPGSIGSLKAVETAVKSNAPKNLSISLGPASSAATSFTPSIFADEAFDMDTFLLRSATANADIHSISPANLRQSLLDLLETVQKMEIQAREDLQNNESSFAAVEDIRTSEIEACENELEEMLERLRVLTSSVSNIWGKSRGTADLLITADRQRTRAAEAVEIIEWFERIKEERLLTVHKEILNPTACWGFAHLVHGLAAFARDLRVSGCATAVADVQQLEELFERYFMAPLSIFVLVFFAKFHILPRISKHIIFRQLLSIFDQAQESDAKGDPADWATMKKCADTLRFLNGGTSVIQHFVCSRPCFFDVTTFERDDELIKSANSMEASAVHSVLDHALLTLP
jgi:hypothetical protein